MPILCDRDLQLLPEKNFREVDYLVTGHAFQTQNDLGNLLKEDVYKAELEARIAQEGLTVCSEVGIHLSFKSFQRRYACDLLVEDGVLYETKTVKTLLGKHQEQLLHYLFLTELRNGKLLNFRPDSLEYHFVSNTWKKNERRNIRIETSAWQAGDTGQELIEVTRALLEDWGTGLLGTAYREALITVFPQLSRSETILHTQNGISRNPLMPRFIDGSFFHFSTLRKHKARYETNLRKWFRSFLTPSIHWINLDRTLLEFRTLTP